MPQTLPDTTGTDLIAAVAAMSKEERKDRLDRALHAIAAAEGEVLALVGEVDRNQDYRDDGATSTEAWLAERYGVSASRARTYVHVGEKVFDTPHLLGALSGVRHLCLNPSGARCCHPERSEWVPALSFFRDSSLRSE